MKTLRRSSFTLQGARVDRGRDPQLNCAQTHQRANSGIPLQVQHLVVGSTTLRDSEMMPMSPDGAPLVVTLCLTLDILRKLLSNISNRVVMKALDILGRLGTSGGAGFSASLIQGLNHSSEDVRAQAVAILPKMTAHGSEFAIKALQTCFQDRSKDVRFQAVAILPKMAARGSEFAITQMAASLAHHDIYIYIHTYYI